jgi:lysophospholipase L1-like esterase
MTERLGRRSWAMSTGARTGVPSPSLLLLSGILWSGCSQAPHEQALLMQAGAGAPASSYSASGEDGAGGAAARSEAKNESTERAAEDENDADDDAEPSDADSEESDDDATFADTESDDESPETETDTDTPVNSRVNALAGPYSQYIAFGDSFASGFGLSGTDPRTCAQSQQAWPPRASRLLRIAQPINFVACSGATTRDVFAGLSLEQTTQLTEPADGEQPISTLVTIQIGGNDLKLGDSIQECSEGLKALKKSTRVTESLTALTQLSPRCANLNWLLDNFDNEVNKSLPGNLSSTFQSLRAAAPSATIIAVGYPHLVDATSACSGMWRLIPTRFRQRMNKLADAINAQIKSAADNAEIVSLTSEVVDAFAGREACSAKPMINSLHMHPNAAGHKQYAQLVAGAVPAPRVRTAADPAEVSTETEMPDESGTNGEDMQEPSQDPSSDPSDADN